MSNIHQVAKHAGVSAATVSRVVSGSAGVVAAPTRRRVMRAVKRLGYVPNSAARNLRMRLSGRLLVMVPDISNPFFSLMLRGIEDAARRDGYVLLLGDAPRDATQEDRNVRTLRNREADGLIVLGQRLPQEAARLLRTTAPRCAPVVTACDFGRRISVPSVRIDNARAAFDAMGYLYALGHRRIAAITGPPTHPLCRDRLRGTFASADAVGARNQLTVVHGDFSVESGMTGADRLLGRRDRPTAVFCFNDEMTLGVAEAARRHSLHVPDDLSIVGFGDIPFARHMAPPLTTVGQPLREIGETCVQLLLEILRNGAVTPASVTLPHRLMIRSTTAPAQWRPNTKTA